MKSFTVHTVHGDARVIVPDNALPHVMKGGVKIAEGVPHVLYESDESLLVCTPAAPWIGRLVHRVQRPDLEPVDGPLKAAQTRAVLAIEGQPVLWGVRENDRNRTVQGVTFQPDYRIEQWQVDMNVLPKPCCGKPRSTDPVEIPLPLLGFEL